MPPCPEWVVTRSRAAPAATVKLGGESLNLMIVVPERLRQKLIIRNDTVGAVGDALFQKEIGVGIGFSPYVRK
jgi:hypothetical protein